MSAATPDRRAAGAATALGVATLAIFVSFQMLQPVRDALESGCVAAESFSNFQLARSMDDLIAVFSAPAGVCRAPIIAAMDAANTLDLYGFVPAYTAYVIAATIALAGPWRTRIAIAAIGAAIVAALGDAVETSTQLRITQDIEGSARQLPGLALGYWVKYGAMGVHAALVAGIALSPPRRRYVTAAFAVIAALSVVGGAFDPTRAPIMTLCFGLFWIALLVMAATSLLRRAAPAPDESHA